MGFMSRYFQLFHSALSRIVSITDPKRIFVVWEDVGRPAKTKDELRPPKRIFFGVKVEIFSIQ
jgi:hypothetical protein